MDRIKNDILTVLGKGNKERTVYLNEVCIDAINKYLALRPDVNTEYFFVSQRGAKLSNRGIQYRIEFYLQEAGFDTKVYSTHKLRHTAATLMYKYGHVDMRALQEILGHASVSTTQIYTHIDSEHLRDAVHKNPLNQKNDLTDDKNK